MSFSKSKMQGELFRFLNLFGEDIARLYGVDSDWASQQFIQGSPILAAVGEMYDYGVMGTPTGDLLPGARLNGAHAHIELFLRGMDTPNMRIYLDERDNTPPHLAMLTVQSVVARIVLDGGDRHTDYGAGEYGAREGDMNHLTLAEVALLANMDERSVRNAANPKLPDPLKTEQVGKRSLVSPEEARRWLAGRKGYIPTKEGEDHVAQHTPKFNIELTKENMEIIERAANKAGISVEAYFNKLLVRIHEGMDQ
jgi:hypothetical protein